MFRAQGATVRAHDSAQNRIDLSGAQLDGISPPQRVELVHQCVFFLTARQMQLKSGRKLEELGVTYIGVRSTNLYLYFCETEYRYRCHVNTKAHGSHCTP